MNKLFGLAISSLTKGYAVTFVPSNEFSESVLTHSHDTYTTTGKSLFVTLRGDDDTEESLQEFLHDELSDHEITDDIYLVATDFILLLAVSIVTDDTVRVTQIKGSLLDDLRQEHDDAYTKILRDVRREDQQFGEELTKAYLPYIQNSRHWFSNEENCSRLRKIIETVYFMDRQSTVSYFSAGYQSVKTEISSILKSSDNNFICPRSLNPYIAAIASFGYQCTNGLLYLAAYSITHSDSDKTRRENWSDFDLAIYAGLRSRGGAVEVMAFRYGYPPHSQRHQLLLVPFDKLIPSGVAFYTNIGIRDYLQERFPSVPYREIEIRERAVDLIYELEAIRLKYARSNYTTNLEDDWQTLYDHLTP
jgi:hypothetical protein